MNSNIFSMRHRSGVRSSGLCLGRAESGQMMVIVALGLIVMLLFAGLVVDIGFYWAKRRQMQTAADAGAVAGRIALAEKDTSAVTVAAKGSTALNGFTDGTDGVTVAVHNGPSTGPYAGDPNFVEVIVNQSQPAYFLSLLGLTTVPVSARAVSGIAPAPNCIITLDQNNETSLMVGATGTTVNASCGIAVDSSGSSAMFVNGGAQITSPTIGIVGDCSGCSGHTSTTPITGLAVTTNPYASMQTPSLSGTCNAATASGKGYTLGNGGSATVNQGVYCGGITVKGSLTLNPGVYILCGGGLSVSTGGTLTGSGVMLFITSGNCASDAGGQGQSYGGMNIQAGATTTLSAATSGSYANLLIFQDPAVPVGSAASKINSGSGLSLTGATYFPTTEFDINSSGTGVGSFGEIIAYKMKIEGGGQVNVGTPSGLSATIKAYPLYE